MNFLSHNYKTTSRPFCGERSVVFQLNVVHGWLEAAEGRGRRAESREGKKGSYELRVTNYQLGKGGEEGELRIANWGRGRVLFA